MLEKLRGDCYTHPHFLAVVPRAPLSRSFELGFYWRYSPATTIDNANDVCSTIQAIEFTTNQWIGGRRWESAMQWQVLHDDTKENATLPGWRVWDGGAKASRNARLTQHLAADTWHSWTAARPQQRTALATPGRVPAATPLAPPQAGWSAPAP